MSNNLLISIITPSYNRADELKYLLKSLENQKVSYDMFEVIISDDGSSDNTKELIKNWQSKSLLKIKYINQKNKGPGAARNHGMKNSKGDLIVFIDSDCEADSNWLKTILDHYYKDNFDACGGPDGSKDDFTILQKAIDYSMTSFFTTGGMRGHSEKMIAKFYPRTHNMAMKRSLYETLGGFGSLRHGQDIEYSNRIRKTGAKIKFIKDAVVYHRRRTSIKQFYKQVFNWGVARINLYLIDQNMLETIHYLPSFALLSGIFLFFFLIFLGMSGINLFLIYFSPLIFISIFGCIQKKEIRILPFLLVVIPIQIIGYGLGFIKAYIFRIIFNKSEFTGFVKDYYK